MWQSLLFGCTLVITLVTILVVECFDYKLELDIGFRFLQIAPSAWLKIFSLIVKSISFAFMVGIDFA